VDTGFPERYFDDPHAAGRHDGLHEFGRLVEHGAENRPEAQLALLGLSPGDVTELVVTHGDIDHVGAIHRFPAATIVVSRAEREAGPPRYFGDVRPVAWPAEASYRLVDADGEIAPGVTLLTTPGHSPGHLSLLVRLPMSGAILLAADAISRERELETGVNVGAYDVESARLSAQRLLDAATEVDALIVYGHDPTQRRTLRWAPDVYR
jgi:N-acyl homoserine lactone hydrolase